MRLCIFLVFLFFLLKCIECLLTLIAISILSQNAFFFYCFSHLLYFFKYFLKKKLLTSGESYDVILRCDTAPHLFCLFFIYNPDFIQLSIQKVRFNSCSGILRISPLHINAVVILTFAYIIAAKNIDHIFHG